MEEVIVNNKAYKNFLADIHELPYKPNSFIILLMVKN